MRNEKYPDPKEIPPIGNTDLTPKDDAELTGYPDSVKFIHLAMTEDYFINISHDKKVLETFICRYADTLEEFDFSSYPGMMLPAA